MWDEITHPFPNFNGNMWEWIYVIWPYTNWCRWLISQFYVVISEKACRKTTQTYKIRKGKITTVCIQHSKIRCKLLSMRILKLTHVSKMDPWIATQILIQKGHRVHYSVITGDVPLMFDHLKLLDSVNVYPSKMTIMLGFFRFLYVIVNTCVLLNISFYSAHGCK